MIASDKECNKSYSESLCSKNPDILKCYPTLNKLILPMLIQSKLENYNTSI